MHKERLEKTVQGLNEGKRYGLMMDFDKTKTMIFGDNEIGEMIIIDWAKIENVEKFTYLRSNMTYSLACKREIATRAARACTSLEAVDKI